MARDLSPRDKIGLSVGGVFTVLVVGLLSYLIGGGKVEVEHVASWGEPPDVRVCTSAPDWVRKDVADVVFRLSEHGLEIGHVTEGPCEPCAYMIDRRERRVVCDDGAVVVDLRDRWFSDDHAGETLREHTRRGEMLRATVLVPSVITDDRPASGDLGKAMSKDARKLVLAHELVHALGYGHSFTRVSKGVVAHKTGELMHPELLQSGWGFGGLP